jgi:hypothetical protein
MRNRLGLRVKRVEYGVQVRPEDAGPAEFYDDLREAKAARRRLGGVIVQRTTYESEWPKDADERP